MIKLMADEQRSMTEYIYALCSITLDASKGYLIESRLSSVAEDAGCGSFTQLLSRAKTDASGALKRRIVDSITTNETLFFRDSAPFELLRNKIIPDLIDNRMRMKSTMPIRIWSAACSTGQEIYSIAMLLKELLRDNTKISVRMLGTDISAVLRQPAFAERNASSKGLDVVATINALGSGSGKPSERIVIETVTITES